MASYDITYTTYKNAICTNAHGATYARDYGSITIFKPSVIIW